MGSASDEVPGGDVIGQYRLEAELAEGMTYRAADAAGRAVVLKVLESDCLLRGQLHPMIKDRLGRVRELAHLGVAQLYGVERDGGGAFAVWEFVGGQTLSEYLGSEHEPSRLRALAHQLAATVESLHALGIVHGAVHERNLIVTPSGEPRLTHVSPFLYNEVEVDVESLLPLLGSLGCGAVVDSFGQGPIDLRDLTLRLAAFARDGTVAAPSHTATEDPAGARLRKLALIGAAAAAVAGAGVAWGLWYWGGQAPPPPNRGSGLSTPEPQSRPAPAVARVEPGDRP